MNKITGFIYLRAILPVFVVAWHLSAFGKSSIMSVSERYSPDIFDVLYINLLNTAVPIFFLMSLFLYTIKSEQLNDAENSTGKYLLNRIKFLLGLFLFWRIIYVFLGIGNLWIVERGIVRNLYRILAGGGDTLLYFLQALIYLTFLIEIILQIMRKLPGKFSLFIPWGGFLASTVVMVLCYALPIGIKAEALRYFSPIGFIPYVFLSLMAFKLWKDGKTLSHIAGGFFVCGILLAIVEWLILPDAAYLKNGYSVAMVIYARPSQLLLAMSILLMSLLIKSHKVPQTVTLLSALSLYVYCIHPVFINLFSSIEQHAAFLLLTFLLTYAASFLLMKCVQLIKSTKKKQLQTEPGIR